MDKKERDNLIIQYLPIVDYVLKGFSMKSVSPVLSIEDLRGAGYIGLIKAIDSYDEKTNVPIKSWLIRKVYFSVIDELRNVGWINLQTYRSAMKLYNKLLEEFDEAQFDAVCEELNLTQAKAKELLGYLSQDIVGCDHLDTYPEEISTECMIENCVEAQDVLELVDKEDRDVLLKYYVLGYTLKEVGEELGMTPQRVLHYLKKIIKNIKKQLETEDGSQNRS